MEGSSQLQSGQPFQGLTGDLLDHVRRETTSPDEQLVEWLARGQGTDGVEGLAGLLEGSCEAKMAMVQAMYTRDMTCKPVTNRRQFSSVDGKNGDRDGTATSERDGPIPDWPSIMRQAIHQHIRPELERIWGVRQHLPLERGQDLALNQGVDPHRIKRGQIADQILQVLLTRAQLSIVRQIQRTQCIDERL